MNRIDKDVDSLTADDGLWEPQREIQHIYETKIETAIYGDNQVDVHLTRDEFDKLCSFIEMFAYN